MNNHPEAKRNVVLASKTSVNRFIYVTQPAFARNEVNEKNKQEPVA